MSSHRKHLRHRNHYNEDKDIKKDIDNNIVNDADSDINNDVKEGSLNTNTIADLINNISPEELNSLLSNFNLDTLNTASKDQDIKKDETISKPTEFNNKSNSKSNSKSNITFDFLTALKPLVSNERGEILDKMLQIYSIGSIFKK